MGTTTDTTMDIITVTVTAIIMCIIMGMDTTMDTTTDTITVTTTMRITVICTAICTGIIMATITDTTMVIITVSTTSDIITVITTTMATTITAVTSTLEARITAASTTTMRATDTVTDMVTITATTTMSTTGITVSIDTAMDTTTATITSMITTIITDIVTATMSITATDIITATTMDTITDIIMATIITAITTVIIMAMPSMITYFNPENQSRNRQHDLKYGHEEPVKYDVYYNERVENVDAKATKIVLDKIYKAKGDEKKHHDGDRHGQHHSNKKHGHEDQYKHHDRYSQHGNSKSSHWNKREALPEPSKENKDVDAVVEELKIAKYVAKAETAVGKQVRKAVAEIVANRENETGETEETGKHGKKYHHDDKLTTVRGNKAEENYVIAYPKASTKELEQLARLSKHAKIGKRSGGHVYSDVKVEKSVEKAVEVAAAKLVEKVEGDHSHKQYSHSRGHSKRSGAKFFNGYSPECEGKIKKAHGVDHYNSRPLKELARYSHPKTCHKHDGHYLRYDYKDLKRTVSGKLVGTHDYSKFGEFAIELVDKKGREEIIVALNLKHQHGYKAHVAAVYVGCDGGSDSYHSPNICRHETYPYVAVEEKGLNEFAFAIHNKHQCRGDYYVAIAVELCDKKGDCHSCKGNAY
ncbi:hypothetical protein FDECE_13331 [Fusarium decemcellulare]|nr:hypothetical protein FDECE_13331 [Fusarium decemcellulare]